MEIGIIEKPLQPVTKHQKGETGMMITRSLLVNSLTVREVANLEISVAFLTSPNKRGKVRVIVQLCLKNRHRRYVDFSIRNLGVEKNDADFFIK